MHTTHHHGHHDHHPQQVPVRGSCCSTHRAAPAEADAASKHACGTMTATSASGTGALDDGPSETTYVCPMHPEIVRTEPGSCPICGMALEPQRVSLSDEPNAELVDMQRRFWVSAAF